MRTEEEISNMIRVLETKPSDTSRLKIRVLEWILGGVWAYPRKGKFLACDNCGKEVYKEPYDIAKLEHHFCSCKCFYIYRRSQSTTRRLVLQALPDGSMAQIGASIGVTRERVRQIVREEGLEIHRKERHITGYCLNCNAPLFSGQHDKFCSMACLQKYHSIELTCEVCGVHFSRLGHYCRASQRRGYKHIFCSKKCQGLWLGNSYGFGVFPEHIRQLK